MKKIIIFGLIAFVTLGTSQTFAQTESVAGEAAVTVETQIDVKTERPVEKPIQKIREVMNSRKEVNTEAKKDIRAIKTERKEDLKDLRGKLASSTLETKNKMEDRRTKMASSTETRKSEKRENMENKINKNLQKVVERFDATILREESIMVKIVSRIEKIKAAGGQTSEAETLVAEAKLNLTEASSKLTTLKLSVSAATAEETTSSTASVKKETLESTKNVGKEIENSLRKAHQALQKSVGSLKGVSQLKNASTTIQN